MFAQLEVGVCGRADWLIENKNDLSMLQLKGYLHWLGRVVNLQRVRVCKVSVMSMFIFFCHGSLHWRIREHDRRSQNTVPTIKGSHHLVFFLKKEFQILKSLHSFQAFLLVERRDTVHTSMQRQMSGPASQNSQLKRSNSLCASTATNVGPRGTM